MLRRRNRRLINELSLEITLLVCFDCARDLPVGLGCRSGSAKLSKKIGNVRKDTVSAMSEKYQSRAAEKLHCGRCQTGRPSCFEIGGAGHSDDSGGESLLGSYSARHDFGMAHIWPKGLPNAAR